MKKPNNIGNIAKILFLSAVLLPVGINLTFVNKASAQDCTPCNPKIVKEIKDGYRDGYNDEIQSTNDDVKAETDPKQDYYAQYFGSENGQDADETGFRDGGVQVAGDPPISQPVQTADNSQAYIQHIKLKDGYLSCKIIGEQAPNDNSPNATYGQQVNYSVPRASGNVGEHAIYKNSDLIHPVSFYGNGRQPKADQPKTFGEVIKASLGDIVSSFPGVSSMMPGMGSSGNPIEAAVAAAATRTNMGAALGLMKPALTAQKTAYQQLEQQKQKRNPEKPAKAPKNPQKRLSNGPPAATTTDPQPDACGPESSYKLDCK